MDMKPAERKALAEACGISDAYLYQVLTRRRPDMPASPALCVLIEKNSKKRIRRWDLRPDDWHLIWPELIGKAGAPSIPVHEVF